MTIAGSGMREIGDQLDPPGRETRLEMLVHQLRDPRTQALDAPGRERGADEAADARVSGGSRCAMPDREVLVERRELALPAGHPLDDAGHPVGAREARVSRIVASMSSAAGQQPATPRLDPETGDSSRSRAKMGYGSATNAGDTTSTSNAGIGAADGARPGPMRGHRGHIMARLP